jgi:hypothetical protein
MYIMSYTAAIHKYFIHVGFILSGCGREKVVEWIKYEVTLTGSGREMAPLRKEISHF